MTAAERAYAYLQIPAEYGGTLGGLVWSASGDAIERWNGTTFAFAEEIRNVIDGAFARPPVPPFEFVLSLLRTMRDGPDSDAPNGRRLHELFTAEKGVRQLLRHAGLLISELCRTLPTAANVPLADDLASAIGRPIVWNEWVLHEVLPLPRDVFARRIEERLAQYDDGSLRHWLKFGCGPLGEPEKIAEPLDTLPVRVEKLLALARHEPRLAGAASLVPALDGGLTLPARRRSPDAVPQGGYCDVTTRGEPDRLLPGQFALDPDEFIRRFAERELLYFQREEPHATRRPERLIVLDQGVRTWGGVRLALAAAALVFMRKEAKRVGRVRFATTASPTPVDVQEADVDSLVKLLESSDLSATPAECLGIARARADATDLRDVILLTHPRALREPPVQAILATIATEERVFALAVEADGAAELVHWKEGGPEVVRRFRVDLSAALSLGIPSETIPAARTHEAEWSGDVEPVPFPFRPGLVAPVERMGFDADGEWLVAASRFGVLQAVGTDVEVLPRAFRDGVALRRVEAVLGVRGGVVVCGRIHHQPSTTISSHAVGQPVAASSASEFAPLEHFVVAHYDRKSRRVKLHDLGGPCDSVGTWAALPELNCVLLTLPGGRGSAVDLASGEVRSGAGEPSGSLRVDTARWNARNGLRSPPYELQVTDYSTHTGPINLPVLRIVANSMAVATESGGLTRLMPMQDGRYLLERGSIERAVLSRRTLAIVQKRGNARFLITIDPAGNRVLGETQIDASRDRFALSPDGRTIAFTRSRFRSLTVSPVGELGMPRAEAQAAGLHDKLAISFDEKDSLRIGIGSFVHTFRIEHGSLRHDVQAGSILPANHSSLVLPTKYDWSRFPANESAILREFTAIADRLGQVLVYRKSGALAAAILVRRERAAAWCPGGVFWGEQSLIGGPPTPHAAEAIALSIAKREAT